MTSRRQAADRFSRAFGVVNDAKFSSLFHLIGQIYTNLDHLASVDSVNVESFTQKFRHSGLHFYMNLESAMNNLRPLIVGKWNFVQCYPFLRIWHIGVASSNTSILHYNLEFNSLYIDNRMITFEDATSYSLDVTAQAPN